MLDFRLQGGARYAVARLDGIVSLDAWQSVLERLEAALQASAAPSRLVIDMRSVLGYLGTPERRMVGTLMAQRFAACEKLAVVVQAQKITDVVSGEARRHGLELRLFPDFDDAIAWIDA